MLVDEVELEVLRKTFEELASHSDGRTINKDTFNKFIPLPGLMGGNYLYLYLIIDFECDRSIICVLQ